MLRVCNGTLCNVSLSVFLWESEQETISKIFGSIKSVVLKSWFPRGPQDDQIFSKLVKMSSEIHKEQKQCCYYLAIFISNKVSPVMLSCKIFYWDEILGFVSGRGAIEYCGIQCGGLGVKKVQNSCLKWHTHCTL